MNYSEKSVNGCEGSPESSAAPAKLLTGQPPARTSEASASVDNVLLGRHFTDACYPAPSLPSPLPAEHPEPHRGYLIASHVLTGIAGLTSIGTIVAEAVGIANNAKHPGEKSDTDPVGEVIVIFLALMLVESVLCLIAMATCFGLLLDRPHKVLIRSPCNGSLGCLCASVFILFLCSVFTATMQAALGVWMPDAVPSPGVCAIPIVRAISLISFFAVLIANSKLHPHDPLM